MFFSNFEPGKNLVFERYESYLHLATFQLLQV